MREDAFSSRGQLTRPAPSVQRPGHPMGEPGPPACRLPVSDFAGKSKPPPGGRGRPLRRGPQGKHKPAQADQDQPDRGNFTPGGCPEEHKQAQGSEGPDNQPVKPPRLVFFFHSASPFGTGEPSVLPETFCNTRKGPCSAASVMILP